MIEFVFWVTGAVILYVYAGYPLLLLWVRAAGGARPVQFAEYEPQVTLIVSAYNEAAVIGQKLTNSLDLDYPTAKLEVLVVSDASSDRTDAIVAEAGDAQVRLLRMPERVGKTLGLNEAVRRATGEILVFSDANAMYRPDAIRQLVRNFGDPGVGAVVGESSYAAADVDADAQESLYWRYEVAIKRLESAVGSVVGGDGAIYATRKALYRDMRADALSDFVNPLQIVQQGLRCIYEPRARSIERAAGGFEREFRRKVRIVNRGWRALMSMKELLNPFAYGLFALQVISHKLLRWLIPAFLLSLLAINVPLAGQHAAYGASLIGQLGFYALAACGFPLRHHGRLPRLIAIPLYFVMVNVASARGIIEACMGRTYTTWTTARARGQ